MRSVKCTQVVSFEGISAEYPSVNVSVLWIPTCPLSRSPLFLHTLLAAPTTPPSLLSLQFGYTPLHEAALKGHLESVRLLLDRGADKEDTDMVRGEGMGLVASA